MTANPHRGEVEIEIAGKTDTIRFGHNDIAAIEHAFGGKSIGVIFTDEQGFGISKVLTIMAAGMARRDRKMTPAKVGDMLDHPESKNLAYYTEKMGEALKLILGDGEDEEDREEGEEHPLSTGTDTSNLRSA